VLDRIPMAQQSSQIIPDVRCWRDRLSRVSHLPPGWTDDMNVELPDGVTVDEVTDFVLAQVGLVKSAPELEHMLHVTFGLSVPAAELVRDRVCGGVVRVATGRLENRPSKDKDPFAWTSYGQATDDPSIITAMYPQFARPASSRMQPPSSAKQPWWKRLGGH